MKITFGLDFGTTNSALAVNINGKVEVIDIDEYNPTGKTMRSVLYFDEENSVYTGQEAINCYITEGASGRFMQSIKSFLPSNLFEHTIIQGRGYELEELIAIILRRIKKKGEEFVGQSVDNVVMGRPVIFSEDNEKNKLAEERLRRAAQIAGFKNIKFQLEPVAAALAFEKTLTEGEEKKVLIGDFGGGTSDFTVIKLSGNVKSPDRRKDVLSLGGVYIAGDAFDAELMWEKVAKYFGKDSRYTGFDGQWLDFPTHIAFKLRQWHLIPQLRAKKIREIIRQIKYSTDDKKAIQNLENLIEDNYGFMLFQSIEKTKIELSVLDDSHILFKEREFIIKEEINRREFEQIIADKVGKIEKCVDEVLIKAQLAEKDIDTVFITGGSSHIPCIRRIFSEKFGIEKMRQMDAFTSVAYGLGISASMDFE